jgi:hypothetical protein
MRVKFKEKACRGEWLFERAGKEVAVMSGEISKYSEDYVAPEVEEEFEIQLLNERLDGMG